MKVSIITVCYNSENTIEHSINSVLAQDYPHIEYIIIDGNSRDNTKSIIDKYKDKIARFVSEKDEGIYDAMNKGISMATGDVIGILNSDDFYKDNTVISKVVNLFVVQNPNAVYGDLVYVAKENTQKIVRYWKAGEYKEGMFLQGWMPPHPAFFVKRNIYQEYGGFNTQLKSAADYELMLRFIHKEKIKVSYLPEVLIKMRAGGESNVSLVNRIRANQEDHLAWKLNGLKPGKLTLLLKPLSKIKQFFQIYKN